MGSFLHKFLHSFRRSCRSRAFARVTIWSVCKTPVIRQNSGECKLSDGPIVLESRPVMFTDFAKIDIRSADNAIELFREFLFLTSWTQIFLKSVNITGRLSNTIG